MFYLCLTYALTRHMKPTCMHNELQSEIRSKSTLKSTRQFNTPVSGVSLRTWWCLRGISSMMPLWTTEMDWWEGYSNYSNATRQVTGNTSPSYFTANKYTARSARSLRLHVTDTPGQDGQEPFLIFLMLTFWPRTV